MTWPAYRLSGHVRAIRSLQYSPADRLYRQVSQTDSSIARS